ncbi:MAG: hypothetical protein ABTR07_09145 [Candidatus Competibacter denitrificans]
MIISSQRFIDDETVQAKLAAKDFTVTLSPEFELAGERYQVVMDGHHSLEAAKVAGVDPVFTVATTQDSDRIYLLAQGAVEDFLEAVYMDSDWYDVADGVQVW